MRWINESWVKLYTKITGDWLRLPVSARGLADELFKYARIDDGFVLEVEPGEDVGMAVAYMLGARPKEHKRIRDDVQALLDDGVLSLTSNRLTVKNFAEAQTRRSPDAVRQQRKRDKENAKYRDASRDELLDTAPTNHGTRSDTPRVIVTGIRDETRRDEDLSPPARVISPASAVGVAWARAGLPPNGNAWEMGQLAEEINAACDAALAVGQTIPGYDAICIALKAITDEWAKAGKHSKLQPSKLRESVGLAIQVARGEVRLGDKQTARMPRRGGIVEPRPPVAETKEIKL